MMQAHSKLDEDGTLVFQSLHEHLARVSNLSAQLMSSFVWADWVRLAGLLHDAGKTHEEFQARLRGSKKHVDHSTLGAQIAHTRYGNFGNLVSYAIAGHHGALPDGVSGALSERTSLTKRLAKPVDLEAFDSYTRNEVIELPDPAALPNPFADYTLCSVPKMVPAQKRFASYTITKMTHSAIVDADYLDTENYMTPELKDVRQSQKPSLTDLLAAYEVHMEAVTSKAPDTPVNAARQQVLTSCLDSASLPQGIFSLTVPTGGGKTLASLGFALRHAVEHGQKRVIFAIPFTSIVEQTAAVYRALFGDDAVLEHHSNFDPRDADDESALRQRLAVQNWDAPIIVTTNVQLLESLFAAKPSRCRKVHNIAESVVVLDEAQTLPDALLKPTLAMFEELAKSYRTSIVLCTATQPALDSRWPFGTVVREIVDEPQSIAQAFSGRVTYERTGELSVDKLAAELAGHHQVLCIVGSRKKAKELYDAVMSECADDIGGSLECEGVFHLSALMVPAHRSIVIDEIKQRLAHGRRCIVVSTQLIEAGVDVDFPIVYREMAGLDSIVQAAGRCNREGRLENGAAPGRVILFDFEPDGSGPKRPTWLGKMKSLGAKVLNETEGRVDDEAIKRFFEERYRTGDIDRAGVFDMLTSSKVGKKLEAIPFESCSKKYKLIEEDGLSVFVPWGKEGRSLYETLLKSDNPAVFSRKVQRFAVTVPVYVLDQFRNDGLVDDSLEPFLIIQLTDGCRQIYSEQTGLVTPGKEELLDLSI